MSRDYKKPVRTAPEKQGHPMLTGLIIGLVGGVMLSIGAGIAYSRLTAPKPAAEVAAKSSKHARANTDAHKSQTKIEFYEILPGKKDPAASAPAEKPTAPAEPAAADNSSKPAAGSASQAYYVQAGTFSSAADADNLKANLAMLLGDQAKVQTVTKPDGTVMHRVRLGPYPDLETAKQKRAQLVSQHMDAIVQKAPPAPSAE
jgi:cell division protein FtsN